VKKKSCNCKGLWIDCRTALQGNRGNAEKKSALVAERVGEAEKVGVGIIPGSKNKTEVED